MLAYRTLQRNECTYIITFEKLEDTRTNEERLIESPDEEKKYALFRADKLKVIRIEKRDKEIVDIKELDDEYTIGNVVTRPFDENIYNIYSDGIEYKLSKEHIVIPYNGEYMLFNNDGRLLEVSNYIDGKLDGVVRQYNSLISSIYHLENNHSEMRYKNGKRDGTTLYFFDNTNVSLYQEYKNHKLNGQTLLYYPSGLTHYTTTYVDDKIHGKYIAYNEYGIVEKVENYDHGQLHGLSIKLKAGQIIRKVLYNHGVIKHDFLASSENLGVRVVKYITNLFRF